MVLEWWLLLVLAFLYARHPLLNRGRDLLQQTSEHNEAVTLHLLTEEALRGGVLPLWNPYMSSGFPVAGDFVSNFWHPVATLPVWIFGGVDGYRVAAFLSFIAAGLGQWVLGYVLGLRTLPRIWASALFMLSGGLALFWRLGWHQLLIGVAWFPWAFAAMIWALRTRGSAPLAWAALAIAMVLTSAGGYYFLYLGVSLSLLVLLLLIPAAPISRRQRLQRAFTIFVLATGLLAVILVPGIDTLTHSSRESPGDPGQADSQPIPYALVNYIVADPDWFAPATLGKAGDSWFYIGWLPLGAMVFLPFAWSRRRHRQQAILITLALTGLFLMWHANRFTVIGEVYERIPLLYRFRFPMRLLVIAACPLLLLAALALQGLWEALTRRTRGVTLQLGLSRVGGRFLVEIPLRRLIPIPFALVLVLSIRDVFTVNQPIAFTTNQSRDPTPQVVLDWLQQRDPDPYYVQLGDERIWWWWTPTAYERRQPVLNFSYNRRLNSLAAQQATTSIVRALPRYILPWPDRPPAGMIYLDEIEGIAIYEDPEALPYAFSVTTSRLSETVPLTREEVRPLRARWANPNQVTVEVPDGRVDDQLVVLVSDFPGWKVHVDGRSASLTPVNGYLGVRAQEGAHRYTFSFEPPRFFLGLTLSALSLLAVAWLVIRPAGRGRQQATARSRVPGPRATSVTPMTGAEGE